MTKLWRAGLGFVLAALLAVGSLPALAAPAGPKGLFIPADKVDELVQELSELSGLPEEQVREKLEAAGREVKAPRHDRRFHPMGRHPGKPERRMGDGEHRFEARRERMAERMEEHVARMSRWMAAHLKQLLEDGRISQEDYDRLSAALEARDWDTLREYAREQWRAFRKHWEQHKGDGAAPEGGAPADSAPESGAPENEQ